MLGVMNKSMEAKDMDQVSISNIADCILGTGLNLSGILIYSLWVKKKLKAF